MAALVLIATLSHAHAESTHVYEVVEETFHADETYSNPYMDVELWVTLNGPDGLNYRIPAFWDGGQTFRVRMVATKPGNWNWSTGTATGDTGLDNQSGSIVAIAWTEEEKSANPNRRGFIRVASNNHTLEYADGTPYFYTADTWWCALTRVYSWGSSSGVSGISFQDAVSQRKAQGFNSINLIASFPSDTMNGKWNEATHGEKIAEDGSLPFVISDSSDPDFGVDYTQIKPGYWQQADRKWKYFSDNGFVPFMESVRRHEQWYDENPTEREAFVNYTRYLWARYGCYNMIYSWVHWDNDLNVLTSWKGMVNMTYSALGEMPYGQPRTAMAWGSSLDTWFTSPEAVPTTAFDLHTVSNQYRDYRAYALLRAIYTAAPAMPAANVEPFYSGWKNEPQDQMSHTAMTQYQMYGSVLNGGFAGHARGDTYYAGVATRPHVETGIPEGDPHVNGFDNWNPSAMGVLRSFILDSGHDYRALTPATLTHLVETTNERRVLALTSDNSVGLGFIAEGFPESDIIDLTANAMYTIEWWNVTTGAWSDTAQSKTNGSGTLEMPSKPDSSGWAFRIKRIQEMTVDFTSAEGYIDGTPLPEHLDWEGEPSAHPVQTSPDGYVALTDLKNATYTSGRLSALKSIYSVSAVLSWSEAGTYPAAPEPIVRLKFGDGLNDVTGSQDWGVGDQDFEATLYRRTNGDYQIKVKSIEAGEVESVDFAFSTANPDNIKLVAQLMRGDSSYDWKASCSIYENDAELENVSTTNLMAGAQFVESDSVFAGIEGGDADTMTTSRRLHQFAVSAVDSAYTQWHLDHGLSGTDASEAADPDGDGIKNLVEYALGGNPVVPGDADILPRWEEGMGFTFPRRHDADSLGLQYEIETSSDLAPGSWTSLGIVETAVTVLNDDFDLVRVPFETTDKTRGFFRLGISLSPQ